MSEEAVEAVGQVDKRADAEVKEYLESRVVRRRFFPRAILVGIVAGILAAGFRLALDGAEFFRHKLMMLLPANPWLAAGVAALVGTVGTLVALWIGKFDRDAGGSGIPHMKAILEGHSTMTWSRLVWVKFSGALAAIGSGLALGREGPTVQMGGAVGFAVARFTKASNRERRALAAAGSGAGLAAAFNAPLAGVTFVLEELQRDFQPVVFSAALLTAAVATVISRTLTGQAAAFTVPVIPAPALWHIPLYIAVGAVAGLLALVFNRGLLWSTAWAAKIREKNILPIALGAGLLTGVAYFIAPTMLGGGHPVTESALYGRVGFDLALVYLVTRLVFVHASYATGVPGGIFAPLLSLGALMGVVLFSLSSKALPMGPGVAAFAVAGMCGLFSGVVRAPLTGIILIAEMTGSYDMLLPLLASAFTAYAVAEGLGDMPIYEALLQRDAIRWGWNLEDGDPITAEYEVKRGSAFDGKTIREMGLSSGVLVIMCREGGRRFIPRANTLVHEHMRIVVAASSLAGLQEVERGVEPTH